MEWKLGRQGLAATLGGMTVLQQSGTKKLKASLTDLLWFTIFGPPYVEMFGRRRLESVPAHEVRTLSNGSVAVQVTPDIPDTPEGWANFKAAHDRCKSQLGSNAFFDPKAPKGYLYGVPEFRFPLEMHNTKGHA
jgi:hypothetical protein